MVETLLEWIGTIIIEGQPVETAMAIYSDSGALVAYGTEVTGMLSNGTAATCTALTTGSGVSTTTGVGLLATEVGAAGYAIAPALGILAGVGLYSLAPDFWEGVNHALRDAGKTIGGKVIAYIDGNGVTHYDEEVLNIYKQKFIEAGIYDRTVTFPPNEPWTGTIVAQSYITPMETWERLNEKIVYRTIVWKDTTEEVAFYAWLASHPDTIALVYWQDYNSSFVQYEGYGLASMYLLDRYAQLGYESYVSHMDLVATAQFYIEPAGSDKVRIRTVRYYTGHSTGGFTTTFIVGEEAVPIYSGTQYVGDGIKISAADVVTSQPNLQPDATYPEENVPISTTYPDWVPWTRPEIPDDLYPTEIPLPNTLQDPAQNPIPTRNPTEYERWLTDVTPIPAPNPNPTPSDTPVDPDPNDPLVPPPTNPTIPTEPVNPDPPNPNPPTDPDLEPVVPISPTTIQSTKLFTVYNPSISAIDDLGAYLWSTNILDLITKIWQNPLDGIISLKQIYTTPTVGQSKNIVLGYLDSEVSAPVVTSQFKRFSCGSVFVAEKNKNVTDYSPYASIHLYLPFIGIVPLDVDEVMNSTLRVEYCVDVYTGTCLAEIYVNRNPDVPVDKILYTFTGNCSQSIPLTSSDATGLASSLASASMAAIGVVAGGGAVVAAGAMAHSLTHEMLHIGHSGSLSANAGIMGQKKPYIIIGRRFGYDANAYNEIYGYPINKTVYLGNCSGFTKVRAINLQSKATEAEKDEITSLLSNGVIL